MRRKPYRENKMEFNLILVLDIVAILIMLFCLYQVVVLRSSVPGGMIGTRWNLLSVLVLLFTIGYLATPFFGKLPADILQLLVACIFVAGAVYVLITIRLIYAIIKELTE
jgi:hypothetical protein